ncbi:MAG: glycine betaine ABC transporter substrate-binding protein [Paracoccus sp. (in: a-proteobacteria)]|uniref:glycine betaine ABC transporter substrate-binding protein n=1 Tax=Paracoccus sp. TaxID=267 RepID=UPI0026E0DA63|nr:glycine betaine ABC transporter substrate-binding protein [Paracoccus sp. (in: a-proteobacteria)]MDO5612544.1 glycine betaine ABC transporter substrate-binding protein [Paracoccus sp. (in: a-proteobacteria)]
MKRLIKAVAAAAMLGMGAFAAQAQDKTIKLGTMAWEDMVPIAVVTKKVLEDKGYTVELTEFSEWGIAYAALTRGDVQVMASQVDFVTHDYWERNKNRLEKLSVASHGLYQGLAVPDYVDIDSLEELNDNADRLGGRIVGIEPGAGLMRETTDAIEKYGLRLQLVEGSTAGMTAALKSAVDRQEPIVVTLWTPTWMAEQFGMKFLADPQGVFAPPQSYNLIAQRGFSEANPEAREILSGIFLPIADIAAINSAVAGGQTMDAAIQSWIDSHGLLLERWSNIKSY